jgi:hypothetical protein
MTPRRIRLLLGLAVLLGRATLGYAREQEIADIIRIHVAALGGQERLDALRAFKGSGYVTTGGQRLAFTIVAARPNRLRMEYHYKPGELVQAWDGINPPWTLDTRVSPAIARPMTHTAAEAFTAEADFDDPLLAAQGRGDTIEFAGTTTIDRRPMIRVLITQKLSKTFFLLLDADTYLIVSRVDPKPAAGPERAEIITEYRNYWPVGGVLAAHAITVWTNGQVTEEAVLENSEANPPLTADTFSQPREKPAASHPSQ